MAKAAAPKGPAFCFLNYYSSVLGTIHKVRGTWFLVRRFLGRLERRPLGSISRDSLLWTAHELAAQRYGRLRWSTSPPARVHQIANPNNLEMKRFEICDAIFLTRSTPSVFATCIWCTRAGEYRPVPSFNPVIEGGKGKGGFSGAYFDVSAPRNDGPERPPQKIRPGASPLSN